MTTVAAPRTAAAILSDLERLGRVIRLSRDSERAALDQERLIFEEGRALVPPVTMKELGDAAGISPEAVTQALHKLRAERLAATHATDGHRKRVEGCPTCRKRSTPAG